VDAAARRRAVSHHQKHCLRESVNFIEPNIRPPNNPDMNQVNRAVWENTSEDGFTVQKFKVFARTKKYNYYCAWQVELPSPKYRRIAASP